MKKHIKMLVNKGVAHAGYEAYYDVDVANYLISKGFAEEIKSQAAPTEVENVVKPVLKGNK